MLSDVFVFLFLNHVFILRMFWIHFHTQDSQDSRQDDITSLGSGITRNVHFATVTG